VKLRSVAVKLLSLLVGCSGCAGDRTEVIRLWPEGAPGSEQRRHEAEIAKDWWVANGAADRYGIDLARVGVMGWSAGGELAALVSYGPSDPDSGATDPLERLSARPNYLGHARLKALGLPSALEARQDAGP